MDIQGFADEDFNLFTIPGLEPRMKVLIAQLRPKLKRIGDTFSPYLSSFCGEEMVAHVAKHARRTVNPPDDTWVAWSNSKRGYKALPHFQVGLWKSHIFIQFALIYECTHKEIFAKHLMKELSAVISAIPGHFFWSDDHTNTVSTLHSQMSLADHKRNIVQLRNVKKAEWLCGLQLAKDHPAVQDGARLADIIENTFQTLVPLYSLAF